MIRQNSSALNGLHSLLRKKLPPLDRGKRRIIILVEKFLGGPKNNQLLNATVFSADLTSLAPFVGMLCFIK